MKRDEQLASRLEHLEKMLKRTKAEIRKRELAKKREAKRLEYEERVSEALKLVEVAKTLRITCDTGKITVYDFLKRAYERGQVMGNSSTIGDGVSRGA